ncbi:MAG: hypothetical protein ACJ8AK_10605 [Gemmatimonadaceae bacterium]
MNALDPPWSASGDGQSDDLAKLDALINQSTPTGGTCTIPGGRTYLIGGTLSVRRSDITIVMTGAILKHSGSGAAFVADGTQIQNGLSNVEIVGGLVDGNAKTTIAWRFRKCGRCRFVGQRARNCALRAFSLEHCVACEFYNPRCTRNDPGMTLTPEVGLFMDSIGLNQNSTDCVVVNPAFEGLTNGRGFEFRYATGNTIIGGTSEANAIGIRQLDGASANRFIGTFFEANSQADVDDAGFFNIYDNCHCSSPGGARFRASSYRCTIRDGYFPTGITIERNCRGVLLDGIAYDGVISDHGIDTRRRNVWHIPAARFEDDVNSPPA